MFPRKLTMYNVEAEESSQRAAASAKREEEKQAKKKLEGMSDRDLL